MISQLVYDEEDFELMLGLVVDKHLQGQHDQATHGKGGGQIPIGMANWVDKVDDIKSAASGLDESLGNRHLAVVLERAGMSEKPTIVGSVEELSGKPMYRGVTDPAHAEQFIDAPVAYQPDGQYGNGTYFADDFNEAKLYSENKTGGFTRTDFADAVVKPTVITAGWKKDAKVLSFRDEKEFLDYKNKLYDKWTKATKMPTIKMTRIGSKTVPARPQDQSPRWNAWKEKFVDNFANRASNVSTLFAMDGVDGYRINTIKEAIRPFREVSLGYTVVLNRGALEVVQP